MPRRARSVAAARPLCPPPTKMTSVTSWPDEEAAHDRISSAALRPGAPMMPPPGCVADPHMYRFSDRRAVFRPTRDRPQEQQLLERELALKDVALAQSPFALEIERRDDLPVQNQRLQIGRVLRERVDDGVAEPLALVVPGRAFQVIRRVLHETRHHVFAGRRDRRVRQARNDDIHVGPSRNTVPYFASS